MFTKPWVQAGDDSSEHDSGALYTDDWDLGAPWLPWASYSPDPVGGLEVDLSWRRLPAGGVVGHGAAPWSHSAASWTLHALRPRQAGHNSIFSLQVRTEQRPCSSRCWEACCRPFLRQ